MKPHGLVCACCVVACCCTSVQAEFFWNKKKDKEEPAAVVVPPASDAAVSGVATDAAAAATKTQDKKALYRLKDEETVQALVKLATGRQLREQELAVVARLISEKQLELTGFNEKLKQEFGISDEGNYHYDNESRTIYELKQKPGADKASKNAKPEDLIEKKVQRKLKNKKTEESFLKMVGAKKITTDEIRALQLILQEKKIELANIQESLQQQFSMAPEKHYEYDADTRVVYELVMAEEPGKATVGKEGKKKAAKK